MVENTKCKIETKRAGLLSRCLSPWEILNENADFDRVQDHLRQGIHSSLRGLRQKETATVLEYVKTPHWSFKKYGRHHGMGGPSVEERVLYRITPSIDVSFIGNK